MSSISKNASFDKIAAQNGLDAFLLEFVYISDKYLRSTFIAHFVRWRNRCSLPEKYELKEIDEKRVHADLKEFLFRPRFGATNAFRANSDYAQFYKSSATRVIKDLLVGDIKFATIHDYHIATMFSCPLVVISGKLIYIHFECLQWCLIGTDGKIKDPRKCEKNKEYATPKYQPDPQYVLTIRWPIEKFLSKIFKSSGYGPDENIRGTIKWSYFKSHPFFVGIIKALKIEIQSDYPELSAMLYIGSYLSCLI